MLILFRVDNKSTGTSGKINPLLQRADATTVYPRTGPDPPIWREVEVPPSITLKLLHDIVQATIDWMDYHLWQFVIDGRAYGLPDDKDWGTARGRRRRRSASGMC
jgi:Plasmid pRiA4b ORF-3-like protein